MSDPRRNTDLRDVAEETIAIVASGRYTAPSGATVELRESVAAARAKTRTYTPEELDRLLDEGPAATRGYGLIEVTDETTQLAARRLAGDGDVALLNFASATRVAGGFLQGARAQEEDLARCSALYACLQPQTEFYAFHRAAGSELYSDRLVYSPRVPFFRTRPDELLEQVFQASVVTAAAPNASRLAHGRNAEIEGVFRRRAGKILALAEAQGHRTVVLGAWGCGVFGNDPVMAADAFGRWLEGPRFSQSFDRVAFAVYDSRPGQPAYSRFVERFSAERS